MNRKERRASGDKGKKGDREIIGNAVLLARQLKDRQEKEESLKLYEKILEYEPDNILALFDLALDNVERGRVELAEERIRKILAQQPKHAGALALLASLRLDQGRREEALKLAEKSRQNGVDDHTIILRLGTFYKNAGMLDRAKEFVYTALRMQPDDIGVYHSLQNLTKYTEADLENLTAISKGTNLNSRGKMVLSFTLGKACLDTGHSDEAFWHYAEANLIKRSTYNYDPSMQEAYVDSIINIFTEETVARLRGKSSITSDLPIFVVGMPRSGSTLVDQILSSHPHVGSVGEARYFPPCVPCFPNPAMEGFIRPGAASITQKLLNKMNGKMLDTIGTRYLEKLDPHVGQSKRMVDKMLFNFLWLGVMRLALPNAKIVNCMRDPIDIGLSIWGILFSDDIMWAYDQEEIARYYLAYSRLMDHWRKLFPGEFHDVQYEKMVADQEGETRRLLEFCNLPWDETVMRFHESTRSVKTASVTQVRKPIYKDSVKKWKKHQKHLQRMVDTVAAKKPEILE